MLRRVYVMISRSSLQRLSSINQHHIQLFPTESMAQASPTEMIIILGSLTKPDGSPTEMLKSRVHHAAELYRALKQKNIETQVIVTGYKASEQVVTEASAMEKYAVSNDLINAEHIIKEEEATSTAENAYFSRIIVDQYMASNVHVVTSEFHMERTKIFFGQLYPPQAYNVKFYACTHDMDDEEKDYRVNREKMLLNYVDDHINVIMQKVMPDHRPLEVLHSNIIPSEKFHHGFTTRHGGVSTHGTLASLNLMYSLKRRDPLVNVQENRKRVALVHNFDIKHFHVARCVHGANVWVIGDPEPDSYDAIVTSNSHVTVAAPGADCPVVLLCDPVSKVCGAAHSGWRGTLEMICVVVADTMVTRFKCELQNILVAIGPSIGSCCFEVGEDVSEKFAKAFGESVVVRREGQPRPFVDLRLSIRLQLENKGIHSGNIDDGKRAKGSTEPSQHPTQCTKCDPGARFFSYRRDGTQFGTQVAFITPVAAEESSNQCSLH